MELIPQGLTAAVEQTEVELLNGQGALTGIQPNQTPNAVCSTAAVSPWGISSMDKRETDQIDG